MEKEKYEKASSIRFEISDLERQLKRLQTYNGKQIFVFMNEPFSGVIPISGSAHFLGDISVEIHKAIEDVVCKRIQQLEEEFSKI